MSNSIFERITTPSQSATTNSYYVITKTDVNTHDTEVLFISKNYISCLDYFHKSYREYLNEHYVVRNDDESHVSVFKRNLGYIYNDKNLIYRLSFSKVDDNNFHSESVSK